MGQSEAVDAKVLVEFAAQFTYALQHSRGCGAGIADQLPLDPGLSAEMIQRAVAVFVSNSFEHQADEVAPPLVGAALLRLCRIGEFLGDRQQVWGKMSNVLFLARSKPIVYAVVDHAAQPSADLAGGLRAQRRQSALAPKFVPAPLAGRARAGDNRFTAGR